MASVSEWLARLTDGQVGQLTPNQYVRHNWPSNDRFGHAGPETFYTPFGMEVPPGGRAPTVGEEMTGAPHRLEIAAAIRRLMGNR